MCVPQAKAYVGRRQFVTSYAAAVTGALGSSESRVFIGYGIHNKSRYISRQRH